MTRDRTNPENCYCEHDVETRYMCMKHQIHLCEDRLKCRDPKTYCKFRPSCVICFMEKERKD